MIAGPFDGSSSLAALMERTPELVRFDRSHQECSMLEHSEAVEVATNAVPISAEVLSWVYVHTVVFADLLRKLLD